MNKRLHHISLVHRLAALLLLLIIPIYSIGSDCPAVEKTQIDEGSYVKAIVLDIVSFDDQAGAKRRADNSPSGWSFTPLTIDLPPATLSELTKHENRSSERLFLRSSAFALSKYPARSFLCVFII